MPVSHSIPPRQLDEHILQRRDVAEERAQRPAVLGGESGDAFAGVGAGIDPDGVAGPAVVERLGGDFFDVVEPVEGTGDDFGVGLDFHLDAAGGAHLLDEVGGGVGGLDDCRRR